MNSKKVQLFILPFAGGSASAFKQLNELINENIEVHVIEYPGRGSRNSEPFCETMESLIADALRQVEEHRDDRLPFALMGYSMGVEVAFDLAQYALKEKPVHLFFAAREAIYYDTNGHDYALLELPAFMEKIVSLGGIDERILSNKRFLEIYMRPIFADYKLLNRYVYREEKGLLNSGLTVFYCEKDTPFLRVRGWETVNKAQTEFFEMGDNHFFINQHATEMAKIINSRLLPDS